jgi:hypothetical protein
MFVDVARLLDALSRTLWRYGMVKPERLKHVVDADGNHTITLTLHRDEVQWSPRQRLKRPGFGASTPAGADGRKSTKE